MSFLETGLSSHQYYCGCGGDIGLLHRVCNCCCNTGDLPDQIQSYVRVLVACIACDIIILHGDLHVATLWGLSLLYSDTALVISLIRHDIRALGFVTVSDTCVLP